MILGDDLQNIVGVKIQGGFRESLRGSLRGSLKGNLHMSVYDILDVDIAESLDRSFRVELNKDLKKVSQAVLNNR